MRISFVGKGGAGKSTITSLFIKNLIKEQKKVLAIDADINQNISDLLGLNMDQDLDLSTKKNKEEIINYLTEKNERIKSISDVYKTTPPGKGSRLINFSDDNYILSNFSLKMRENAYLMQVGTYEKEGIGTSCYHTDLSVFENILSHVKFDGEWLVSDMVAGTDSFSNTLHAQFDAIFLIVEPTPEGVNVYKQFKSLAEEANIENNLYIIGNKIMDEEDVKYLDEKIKNDLIGYLKFNKDIKKSRQRGKSVNINMMPNKLFKEIKKKANKSKMSGKERLNRLHKLHKKYAKQDYVKNSSGDIMNQIDKNFSYEQN